jgi:hypothetical protein
VSAKTGFTEIEQVYNVIGADRNSFGSQQPNTNFWWSETNNGTNYFDTSTFYKASKLKI